MYKNQNRKHLQTTLLVKTSLNSNHFCLWYSMRVTCNQIHEPHLNAWCHEHETTGGILWHLTLQCWGTAASCLIDLEKFTWSLRCLSSCRLCQDEVTPCPLLTERLSRQRSNRHTTILPTSQAMTTSHYLLNMPILISVVITDPSTSPKNLPAY